MREAILSRLQADETLTNLLTGGIYSATEISRQTTSAAFDDFAELKPCMLLKLPQSTSFGPFGNTERLRIQCYFYERIGYSTIIPARNRVYQLINRQLLTPSEGSSWEIIHDNDLLDQRDEALNSSLIISRYYVAIAR